jgi:hypothetical protein
MRTGGLVWLATLLPVALPGAVLLAHSAFARLPLAARAVLAGAAGAVLVSFAMTVFALFAVPWSLPGVLAAAVVLAFLIRPALRPSDRSAWSTPPGASSPPDRRISRLGAALSWVTVASAALATAAGSASSPDLIFFWGPKAQRFALARTVDARFLADPYLSYMHAYYPPLVTNLYALCSLGAGRMSWTAATFLFPLLLAALALALPGLLRTATSAPRAAAASALTVCALAVIGTEADIGGNAEMPLLVFEATAIAILISPLAEGPAGQLLAGILLAGAVCAKIEGLPFAAGAIAAFVWMRPRGGGSRAAALRLLSPAVVSLGAWFAFGASRRLFRGYSGEGSLLAFHPEYALVVLRAVGETLAATAFGLPWAIPLLCLLAVSGRLERNARLPLMTAAALVAFLLFTYLDRPENPVNWIAWSAARVLSPIPMLFSLAAACARDAPTAGRARSREAPPPSPP